MRDSLKKSLADSPVEGFERYQKGSIVICNSCAKPIFKLDAAIVVGDKAGAAANLFKPLSLEDVHRLAERTDIDAGLRALLKSWDIDARRKHVQALREVKAGEPMLCPLCTGCFVQVLSVDKTEAIDRAFTIELVTIPPAGTEAVAIRGRRIGTGHGWLH